MARAHDATATGFATDHEQGSCSTKDKVQYYAPLLDGSEAAPRTAPDLGEAAYVGREDCPAMQTSIYCCIQRCLSQM